MSNTEGETRALVPRTRPTAQWASVLLLSCALLPFVLVHLRNVWLRPHYQFFPFLLAGAVLLLWQRWPKQTPGTNPERTLLEPGLMLLGATGMLVSVVVFSPAMGTLSALLVILALILRFAGPGGMRELFPVWCLLCLIIPPPFRLDFRLIQWLQSATARLASEVLDVFGVEHLLQGNLFVLPGRRIFVEEACSGVNSLYTLFTATALFVVCFRRPLARALMLLGSTLFWAALLNTCRLAVVVAALQLWQIDLSTGMPHTLLGISVFVIGLPLIASTDSALTFFFSPIESNRLDSETFDETLPVRLWNRIFADRGNQSSIESSDAEAAAATPGEAAPPTEQRRTLWGSSFAFAGLAVIQVMLLIRFTNVEGRFDILAADISESFLNQRENNWELTDFREVNRDSIIDEGAYSKVWTYRTNLQSPALPIDVSLDYPFHGWHELISCYRAQGWTVLERNVREGESQTAFVEVQLQRPSGEYGFLLFALFDGQGRRLNPPVLDSLPALGTPLQPFQPLDTYWDRLWRRVAQRVQSSPVWNWKQAVESSGNDFGLISSTYQVQTFALTDAALNSAQRQMLRTQFLDFHGRFAEFFAAESGAAK